MKIVVTGAAGFVGTHLLNALESGHTADTEIIPTAQTAFTRADGLVVRALEITQRVAINAFVQEVRPTHIVHLAGVPSIAATRADPVRAWEVNLMGTLDLARAVLEHAPDCALIFAGSAEFLRRERNVGRAPNGVAQTTATERICGNEKRGRPGAGRLGRKRAESDPLQTVQSHRPGSNP